jgi:hypothetical protein
MTAMNHGLLEGAVMVTFVTGDAWAKRRAAPGRRGRTG